MNTQNLLETLRHIVGAKYVITDPSKTERYRTGYRFGTGNAIAVVRPATLWEQWQVLEACVAADVIVISQAANTGITGGSNPFGNDYDRDVVMADTPTLIPLVTKGERVSKGTIFLFTVISAFPRASSASLPLTFLLRKSISIK